MLSSLFNKFSLRLSVFSRTGVDHSVNQDHFSFRSPEAFIVADGVGGGAWGEVASLMLVEKMLTLDRPDEQAVDNALARVDREIASELIQRGDGAGASVCACLWLLNNKTDEFLASWVGDCQLMQWRLSGGAWQLKWASLPQTYKNLSLLPPQGVLDHSPTNMVGCGMSMKAMHKRLKFKNGDRILMASDGFWRNLTSEQLVFYMNANLGDLYTDTAKNFCDYAYSNGSTDDITVLIIEKKSLYSNFNFFYRNKFPSEKK
jgi:serine/threonine protein phosphatase PrpC